MIIGWNRVTPSATSTPTVHQAREDRTVGGGVPNTNGLFPGTPQVRPDFNTGAEIHNGELGGPHRDVDPMTSPARDSRLTRTMQSLLLIWPSRAFCPFHGRVHPNPGGASGSYATPTCVCNTSPATRASARGTLTNMTL